MLYAALKNCISYIFLKHYTNNPFLTLPSKLHANKGIQIIYSF